MTESYVKEIMKLNIKRILLGGLLIMGLVSCANLYFTIPSGETKPPVVTQFPTTTSTANPSPTIDGSCWKSEKKCAIANSLGFHVDAIVSFSPNLQWVAVYNTQRKIAGKFVGGLRFIKADGNSEWIFSSTQLTQDIGECALFWTTDFWSSDSRFVYFSPDPSYCSRPNRHSTYGTQVLYRLDVQTGEFTEVLPIKFTSFQNLGLYTFEFSSDGKFLAYFQTLDSPVIVKIRDLAMGKELNFPLEDKYHEAGCLVWTTDNQSILFYAAKNTVPGTLITSSLFSIDSKDQVVQVIYSDLPNIYCPLGDDIYRDQIPKGNYLVPIVVIGTDIGINYFRGIDWFYLNPYTREKVIWPTSTPVLSQTSSP
jgi:hypothetical protein